MDDFRTLLDGSAIAQIQTQLSDFVHSADDYSNKLKLVFALLCLIKESSKLLQSVDSQSFINDIQVRIEDIKKQSQGLNETYHEHLTQNNEILELLNEGSDNKIGKIQADIAALLADYDNIIKGIVEIKDSLPIEKQLEKKH